MTLCTSNPCVKDIKVKKRAKTELIYRKLCDALPGGVNSPVRACKNMGQIPLVVDHGYKDQLVDCDGHSYIDFCGSWGALIHGHAHPEIVNAIQKRLLKGTSFGVTTELEGEIAKKIKGLVPSVEKIRFVSSGTEATMSAVRLARGFTKKKYLIKFSGNYHGHADFFLVQAGSGLIQTSPKASSDGIPEEIVKCTLSLPYNDLKVCQETLHHPDYRDQIAAVILEPIAGNMGVIPPKLEFLQFLREATREIGALLIFDEVITGFRVSKSGAQGLYGVTPDLSCFGKIMGGGLPGAAFGGKKEIMDYLAPLGSVYQAGTLSGNPLTMQAGLQSLIMLDQPGFYEELNRKSQLIISPLIQSIQKHNWNICIQSVGSMFSLFFGKKQVNNLQDALEIDTDLYAKLFRFLFNEGIYIPPSAHEAWFVSHVHTDEHLKKTREAILEFMQEIDPRSGR